MCVHIFSPEFMEGGTFWWKMLFFYVFTMKRPIFFFGKIPSESNHDNEPAFKELNTHYKLRVLSLKRQLHIDWFKQDAEAFHRPDEHPLRFYSLNPLLLSAQSPLSVTVGWEAFPKSTTRRTAWNERREWKWMMIILNSPGFLCFSFCFWY